MQKLTKVFLVLVAVLAIPSLSTPAAAQKPEQPAQNAIQELMASNGNLRALGSEEVQNSKVEALSGSALKLRFDLPARIKSLAKTDPNAGRVYLACQLMGTSRRWPRGGAICCARHGLNITCASAVVFLSVTVAPPFSLLPWLSATARADDVSAETIH